jgi:hypothetical protein
MNVSKLKLGAASLFVLIGISVIVWQQMQIRDLRNQQTQHVRELQRLHGENIRLAADAPRENSAKSQYRRLTEIRASDFGLLSDLGIRASDFDTLFSRLGEERLQQSSLTPRSWRGRHS